MGIRDRDYYARKRQWADATCDVVKSPHPAPWDAPCEAPDTVVEALAREWLVTPASWTDTSRIDEISAEGPRFAELLMIDAVTINQLFSAGQRGAFHLSCTGTYTGGFEDIDPARTGQSVTLHLSGIFDVAGGKVARVHVTADRPGRHRSLMGPNLARSSPPAPQRAVPILRLCPPRCPSHRPKLPKKPLRGA